MPRHFPRITENVKQKQLNNANIHLISPVKIQQLLINSIIKLNKMNYMRSVRKQLMFLFMKWQHVKLSMWVSELLCEFNCGRSFTPTFLRQSVTYTHARTLIYVTENSI